MDREEKRNIVVLVLRAIIAALLGGVGRRRAKARETESSKELGS